VHSLQGHDGSVFDFCFLGDSEVITASHDKTARRFSLISGEALGTLRGHEGGVTCVCVDQFATFAVTGSLDCTVRLWSLKSMSQKLVISCHSSPIEAVCTSRDVLFSGDAAGNIWSNPIGQLAWAKGKVGMCFQKGKGIEMGITALSVHVHPDNLQLLLVSSARDGSAKLWSALDGSCPREFKGHSEAIRAHCALLHKGTEETSYVSGKLFTASEDTFARVFDIDSGETLAVAGIAS
jgi:dynein assembly factor with WDR repeat domains 1